MAQCVYCDSVANLNTQLTVSLDDGTRVTVNICDVHADDASVKSAREAYLSKQRKIEEVLAQARALGLDLSQSSGGITVAKQQTQEARPKPQEIKSQQIIVDDMDGDDVVDTAKLDNRPGMRSIGGQTEMGLVASHSSHQVSGQADKLDPAMLKGKAKMQLVEGREGVPLAIPEKRVDGLGTMRIKVANVENDQRLQTRFKKMASDSLHDKIPNFARQGYTNTTTSCPLCHGNGSVTNAGKVIECPKCNGVGIISVY